MENLLPKHSKLTKIFARWRKDPWPMPTGLKEPVSGAPAPKVELTARQEWEDEGGAVKPVSAHGPKLPL